MTHGKGWTTVCTQETAWTTALLVSCSSWLFWPERNEPRSIVYGRGVIVMNLLNTVCKFLLYSASSQLATEKVNLSLPTLPSSAINKHPLCAAVWWRIRICPHGFSMTVKSLWEKDYMLYYACSLWFRLAQIDVWRNADVMLKRCGSD